LLLVNKNYNLGKNIVMQKAFLLIVFFLQLLIASSQATFQIVDELESLKGGIRNAKSLLQLLQELQKFKINSGNKVPMASPNSIPSDYLRKSYTDSINIQYRPHEVKDQFYNSYSEWLSGSIPTSLLMESSLVETDIAKINEILKDLFFQDYRLSRLLLPKGG
jgi:hypothetical protein